jgi:DNA-binding CsgD family transcriptional regulator
MPSKFMALNGEAKLALAGAAESAVAQLSEAGFVLLDSAYRLVYATPEAVQILTYQAPGGSDAPPEVLLPDRLRAMLPLQRNKNRFPKSASQIEFVSGKRHYLCRAFNFPVRSGGPPHANTALVLERVLDCSPNVAEIAKEFHLARREREAVELLMLGLSNKDLARRMNLSVNTVKTLLRLTMAKMETSDRSEILGKIHARAAMRSP